MRVALKVLKKAQSTHISIKLICRLFRHKNQVSVNAFLQQVLASLSTIPWLQLKFSVQTFLGALGDVHSPVEHTYVSKQNT